MLFSDRTTDMAAIPSWSFRHGLPTIGQVEDQGPERARAQAAYRRRLGVTLRRIRERLTPYSQESIAEVLGVDKETVGRWERGEREPKAWQLGMLAERYALPDEAIAWLLYPTDSITELDDRIEGLRTEHLRRAAVEAAQADVAAERARRGGAGRSVRHGTSQA
jgi:transcriptional regulator with XRE-family HTH domain